MEQNRCLLDVIDNPQLLQSFLESESSAETNHNNSSSLQQSFTEPQQSNDDAIFDKEALLHQQQHQLQRHQLQIVQQPSPPSTASEINTQSTTPSPPNQTTKSTPPTTPITEAAIEEPPNSEVLKPGLPLTDVPITRGPITELPYTEMPMIEEPSTTNEPVPQPLMTEASTLEGQDDKEFMPEEPIGEELRIDYPPTEDPPKEDLIEVAPIANPLTTTVPSSEDLITRDAQTGHDLVEHEGPTEESISTEVANAEEPSAQAPATDAPVKDEPIPQAPTSECPVAESTASEAPMPDNTLTNAVTTTPIPAAIVATTPTITTSSDTISTSATTITAPTPTSLAITTTSTTTTTTSAPTIVTPKTSTPTKRPPAKRSAPRPSKAKKAATATNNTTTNQTQPAMIQNPTMQTQYTSSPVQQQMMFQTTNNAGIRQPALIATSPMGQTISGIPQQQRVIQIQTANGPMYFAIASGPAVGSNPMMNQQQQQQQQQQQHQQQQQQQQSQQPGMQSQQYTQQQVCFQPNSNVMINRPQLATNPNSNQQQSAVQMQPGQPRLGAPLMAGQTLAIANQQNSQQQHIVLPPTQPIMMPRMPNQLILNRPPGQLLPGQQQFIQIQTPNGPMLLALPTQQPQQQQQQQTLNNNTMIEYNNQIQHQQQLHHTTNEPLKSAQQSSPVKQASNSSSKSVANSKSGLDLGDLLLDCGILPEDKMTATQSPSGIKTSQSPVIQPRGSTPHMPQMNSSPMPSMDSSPMINNTPNTTHTNHPHQAHPSPIQSPYVTGQPMQQQPIRITFGPDGQMIMQPTVYGAIRPVLHPSPLGQTHLSTVPPNSIVPSVSPMMTLASTPSSINNNNNNNIDSSNKNMDSNSKKSNEGKTTKKSRSKKSDKDKFPTLKTPKILQQQQKQQQQQQQQQQQMQTLAVLPMTVMIGDQNKTVLAAAGSDVKPNVTQLASGQQLSLAKIVTPVMQTASLQPLSVNSNMIQSSIPNTNIIATTHIGQNQSNNNNIIQNNNSNSDQNTQLASDSGNSINSTGMIIHQQPQHQTITQNSSMQEQQTTTSSSSSATLTTSSTSQMCSSGNVTTNLLQKYNKSGTVETNPHISSSLMPTTISLSVDTPKIEQNGYKLHNGQNSNGIQKHQLINSATGQPIMATLVIHQTQTPAQNAQNQAQELARKLDLRAQSILNQLAADQNSALNIQQTKQAFKSLEDACKRLLRYHVFDTETVDEAHITKDDKKFDAAAESLIARKKAIYDKYRLLILKQSMKIVPSSEEVMLEQVYVNDEHAFLKKERELFREYEAHLESMALKQSRTDSHNDCGSEYFAFGENSPKRNNQDDLSNSARPREVDDWLMTDKWGDSRYPSVEDNEAATAIESILNEELS